MSFLGFTMADLRPIRNFFVISLRDRYLGSRLGLAWAVLQPLLMFVLYTVVFGFVFKVRLPGAETTLGYAIWLISGFGPWMAISESLVASASSVVASAGLIKNVAFRNEILPVVAALMSLVTLLVSLVFLEILLLIDGNLPTWHLVFLLPSIFVMYLLMIAIAPFLATVSVFVRDTVQVLPTLLQIVLFSSPVLYPMDVVPAILRRAAAINPIYILADSFRACILRHEVPDLLSLGLLAGFSLVLARFSFWFYRRGKGQFEAYL